MSEGLNRCMFLGTLGADGELRYGQSGMAVLKLRLACNERFKDKDSQWKDRTDWVNITVFGKRAESLANILRKGETVFVEGSLRTSSYDKDGEKRYRTEIIANTVLLTGSKGGGQRRDESHANEASPNRVHAPEQAPADDGDGGFGGDDDIPF